MPKLAILAPSPPDFTDKSIVIYLLAKIVSNAL
jgi:hypothetical protein